MKLVIKDLKNKAQKEINSLREIIKEQIDNISVSPISEKKYNYEFTVDDGESKLKVMLYFGKKGIKKVIQGSSLSGIYNLVNEIINENLSLFKSEQEGIPDKYIGSDESGKGDFFGPLVVSAFYTDSEISKHLTTIGVRDSKELSDDSIKKIAAQIKKHFPKNFSIISLEPEQYNQLYKTHGSNLNKLLIFSHSRAVEKLLNKFDVKFVITDKFSFKNLDLVSDDRFRDIKFVQETKAEKYLGVAAASILARNEVVLWFENLEAKGVKLPKGASSEVDTIAKKLAAKYGKENLNRICKTHFKNFSKI